MGYGLDDLGTLMSRRAALKLMVAGMLGFALRARAVSGPVATGSPGIIRRRGSRQWFIGTVESLRDYRVPQWFKDAKLGVWAHWGPQSEPGYGDWYARNMYIQGTRQYRYHLARYGHPSVFGYKDVIQLWRGQNFDPEYLVRLYKRMGARYFVSMGVHVDNFDLWDSRHTRWNSVNFGPRRDIVGLFRRAALKHGLRFGVSDHLWMAYKWMSVARGSDTTGPYAGVPYDGADPRYWDLYGDCPRIYRELPWDEEGIPEKWQVHWAARISDLIERYEPDFVYCDGPIPFGRIGLELVAHFYNVNLRANGGRLEAVYTCKSEDQARAGICVFDKERGVVEEAWPAYWQTCTCIGNWHYDVRARYKSPKRVIDMFVDIISRNGNLLLNFPLRGDGTLDDAELRIIDELTEWMRVNGEAVFGTRAWRIWGGGPTVHRRDPGAKYTESLRADLTHEDVRFTCKDGILYAFFMGWPPDGVLRIPQLGFEHPYVAGRIQAIDLLGSAARIRWEHNASELKVWLPALPPCKYACALKIVGLET